MKRKNWKKLRAAAVVLGVLLTASLGWARGFDDPSAGAPPIGILEDEYASGSKLIGPAYIKIGKVTAPFPVEAVVRVQRGAGLWIFQGITTSLSATDPALIQSVLTQVIGPQILATVFADSSAGLDCSSSDLELNDCRLKRIDEFAQVELPDESHTLADVQITVDASSGGTSGCDPTALPNCSSGEPPAADLANAAAAGTKLSGVLFTKVVGTAVESTLRVRQGNDLFSFQVDLATALGANDAETLANAVAASVAALAPDIAAALGDPSLNVEIKSLEDFAWLDSASSEDGSIVSLTDVQLVAK